jgi:glucose-1-phosphate adenylyltransferase
MDYGKMLQFHIDNEADATIAALPVQKDIACGQFGVLEIGRGERVVGFEEKPQNPKTIPGLTDICLASMGIYVFSAKFLYEELCKDAIHKDSKHDFGTNIIPSIIDSHRVFAFPFMDENRKTEAYWRDVGTIDAFYDANMDLVSVDPLLNLYDSDWPIYTHHPNLPPPKFVFAHGDRSGRAMDSVVCPGSIISGGTVTSSILGHRCRINSFSKVEESILFSDVNVGRNAQIRNAIIDKGVVIPEGETVGIDHDLDRSRGFTVTERGITVVAKFDGHDYFGHS